MTSGIKTEVDDASLSKDDVDDVIEMERQLAFIQAKGVEAEVKCNTDTNSDIRFESDHAALNLEKEMNVQRILIDRKLDTVVEPVEQLSSDPPSTTTKAEKKQSASSRIKFNLLQRMAEGREVDVDATNAAASENDYKNTFCYLCRIDFSSSKGLYLHNVKTHSEGEVQCDVCFKPLKNRITLMKHKKLHLGAEDMQCLCTDCGRPFKDKRALTAHVTYTKHMLGVSLTKT
ncbi:zinc finger, C2H2 type [Dictyocaulus viviparus]|uniref:Zinc finger, C2H2 type n=1 Tax=Dictyocaulus viviparus TaxID=29172 RepID=A0A0D8XWX4_DICVI|nr:zinc finger, C2H2 type [Dictyocaulus viviparus]